MRVCCTCKIEKEPEKFGVDNRAKDGIRSRCKDCRKKEDNSKYRNSMEGKESNRKAVKKYSQSNRGKAARSKAQDNYRLLNPEKTKAHEIVRYAIETGELVPEPCPCGETEVEGHHPDYNKPLEVKWLCKKCHIHEHKKKDWIIA